MSLVNPSFRQQMQETLWGMEIQKCLHTFPQSSSIPAAALLQNLCATTGLTGIKVDLEVAANWVFNQGARISCTSWLLMAGARVILGVEMFSTMRTAAQKKNKSLFIHDKLDSYL